LLEEVKSEKKRISTLKKRLILFSRLMALMFLVLAVSSPYFSNASLEKKPSKGIFIYLDNSFSMESKLGSLSLLGNAKIDIEKIYEEVAEASKVYLLSNDNNFEINSKKELLLELSKINLSNHLFSSDVAKARVKNLARSKNITESKILFFSDFKETINVTDSLFSDIITYKFEYNSENENNISLDSVWISNQTISENIVTLKYKLSNYGNEKIEYSESFEFDNKIQQSLTKELKAKRDTVFEIDIKTPASKMATGVISIQDNSLDFDNRLYFSLDFSSPSKILFVGNITNDKLNMILNDSFSNLESTSHNNFKFLDLSTYDFIIYSINNNVSNKETELLNDYIKSGNNLMLYPEKDLSVVSFNKVLKSLELANVVNYSNKFFHVSDINYNDVFFDDIFQSHVSNFDYPKLVGRYLFKAKGFKELLKFDDGSPFLIYKNYSEARVYIFLSTIFSSDKSFINYDLSIPVLYKISTEKHKRKLYFNVSNSSESKTASEELYITEENNIELKIEDNFFPLQENKNGKVTMPSSLTSGLYELYSDKTIINTVAVNNNRTENIYQKTRKNNLSKALIIKELKKQNNVIYLWKWCITFTILFLLMEMSIITFLKD